MTEGAYISDLVNHMALSHPEISFKLISNGKNVISTTGDGRLKETIYSLYGSDITKSLLPVDYQYEDIKITGFIGKPFLSKGNRSFENYFVNKRYIKSNVINKAIEEAYKTYVMQHRFPFTVLFLEVNPESCDVNIHPAKLEFRYDNEKALFHAVFHAVHDTLQEKELMPDAEADYGQKQKVYTPLKQTPVAPVQTSVQTIPAKPVQPPTQPKPAIQPKPASTVQPTTPVQKPFSSNVQPTVQQSSYSILESILPKEYREQLHESRAFNAETESKAETQTVTQPVSQNDTQTETTNDVQNEAATVNTQSQIEVQESVQPKAQERITTGEQIQTFQYLSKEALSKHRIIGQLFKTYWLTEYNNELYIMDQHAAHEKVNYETFLAEFKERRIVSQQLFPPLIITLSAAEKLAVMENIEYFNKTGFEIGDFGGNEVNISSVPVNLIGLDPKDIFLEFAEYLSSGVSGLTEDIFVRKLGTMGCKAAIKGNQEISLSEAQTLIEKLLTLENPYTCPHGRPTIIRMTKDEIDKKFKRIVE